MTANCSLGFDARGPQRTFDGLGGLIRLIAVEFIVIDDGFGKTICRYQIAPADRAVSEHPEEVRPLRYVCPQVLIFRWILYGVKKIGPPSRKTTRDLAAVDAINLLAPKSKPSERDLDKFLMMYGKAIKAAV